MMVLFENDAIVSSKEIFVENSVFVVLSFYCSYFSRKEFLETDKIL